MLFRSRISSAAAIFSMSSIFLMLILYLRTPPQFNHPQLWAEDGVIFLTQSYSGLWSSVVTPYAGYLHVLLRMASYIATLFDFYSTPTLYLMFSILFAMVLGYSVFRALHHYSNFQKFISCISIGFALYGSNEVFNNLTNSQWYLGAALLLSALWETPLTRMGRMVDLIIIFLLGMTGPFSMIFSPVYCLRLYYMRDGKQLLNYYLAWFIPGLLQFCFFMHDDRFIILKEQGQNICSLVMADWMFAPLFAVTIFILCKAYNEFNKQTSLFRFLNFDIVIMVSGILCIYVASYLMKETVEGRLVYIPTLLLTIIAIIFFKNKWVIYAISIILVEVQFYQFKQTQYHDLNWSSYYTLIRTLEKGTPVSIPINPENKSSWHMRVIATGNGGEYILDLLKANPQSTESFSGLNVAYQQNGLVFKTSNANPHIMFDIKGPCLNANDIALEVQIASSREDYTQLYWRGVEGFSNEKSIKQYTERSPLYFAFKNPKENTLQLRYSLMKNSSGEINKLRLHCMPARVNEK